MGFIEITARRLEGGQEHQHIVAVRTVDRTGRVAVTTPSSLIEWLDTPTNVAVVYTASRRTRFIVGPYRAADGTRCLRAYTQSGWEDHLLMLPEIEPTGARAPFGSDRADEPPERPIDLARQHKLSRVA
jgi:hypothetical protein